MAQHDAILRDVVESAGGQVVKTTGDGFFAVFGRVEAALMAALATQRALAAAAWGKTGALRVRVGVHTGDAEFGGGDYHGPAVNRAARLMTAGHGGQVLVSGATAALGVGGCPRGRSWSRWGRTGCGTWGAPSCFTSWPIPTCSGGFRRCAPWMPFRATCRR